METSKLNAKGQVLIPETLKTKYGFTNGIRVVFEETANGILLIPMNEEYFERYAGILKGNRNLKSDMKKLREE